MYFLPTMTIIHLKSYTLLKSFLIDSHIYPFALLLYTHVVEISSLYNKAEMSKRKEKRKMRKSERNAREAKGIRRGTFTLPTFKMKNASFSFFFFFYSSSTKKKVNLMKGIKTTTIRQRLKYNNGKV